MLTVTSDHGESLGEHGEKTHGYFVYDSTLRIPWILKAPRLAPGRFPHQVRIVDVMPTMSSLAGVAVEPLAGADGEDLRRFVENGDAPRARGLLRDAPAAQSVPVERAAVAPHRAPQVHRRAGPELYDARGRIPPSSAT